MSILGQQCGKGVVLLLTDMQPLICMSNSSALTLDLLYKPT